MLPFVDKIEFTFTEKKVLSYTYKTFVVEADLTLTGKTLILSFVVEGDLTFKGNEVDGYVTFRS
jgi:hypothetical protein